ncbi:MAG: PEP-utilizing enzyme [Patescibacteria group bacterium]
MKIKSSKLIWTYYFARKFSASRFELVMRVYFSDFYKKHFGVRLRNCLVKPGPGINHSICYIDSEWKQFVTKVYRATCKNWLTFKYYVNLIKQTQKKSLSATQKIVSQPLKKLSWQQLGDLWVRWDKAQLEHFLKPIWIPFIIEPFLATEAKKILGKLLTKIKQSNQEAQYVEIIFGPDYPNAITLERVDLIKVALLVLFGKFNKRMINKKIINHTQKYGFIPCYDVIDTHWDEKYFSQNLKNLLKQNKVDLSADLKNLNNSYTERRRAFKKVLKKLKPNKTEKDLLQMVHTMAFIKDERDDYRRRMSFTIQPLFEEIARRYKLPFRALLYLLKSEMEMWFATGKLLVSVVELKQRMSSYSLVYINNGPVVVSSGFKMKKFLNSQKFTTTDNTKSEVKGIIGNKGIARGSVCIIRTKHDLRKIAQGDILVAVTTSPDYVSTMRRCRAFVTDEGGLTSHAAIVAREVNLPCIVGTKNATEVFKDNDIVEVDANKGIVRKLNTKDNN